MPLIFTTYQYSFLKARPSAPGNGNNSRQPLEDARVLLERIRQSQNSNYYDNSLLLQNSGNVPIRNVAPNEYNHIDNSAALTRGLGVDPLTLGDVLGRNLNQPPGGGQSNSDAGGYLANSPGVAQNWQGGSNPSIDNSNIDNINNNNNDAQRQPGLSDLFPNNGLARDSNSRPTVRVDPLRPNSTAPGSPLGGSRSCDLIGPSVCPLPLIFQSTETRTEEEIKKDLWQPGDVPREEWLRCHGMSCEDKALAEDLMEELQYELTNSEYQPPEAVRSMVVIPSPNVQYNLIFMCEIYLDD